MDGTHDGLLVLDKPAGMTSRDAVDRALRWFGRRTKVGHTGTLDPFATGVLVLCLGSATRLAEYVQRMGKTYRSTFAFGSTSDTDDRDGVLTPVAGAADPGGPAVLRALAALVGTIEQVPPAYSAAKVGGRRAYDAARKGEQVALAAKKVQVYGIDVLRYDWPTLDVEVRCGKGTYVRSLARDAGAALGCGGYVSALRRTRVGPFAVEDALPLDADAETARRKVLPASLALAELRRVVLGPEEIRRMRNGQAVSAPAAAEDEVALFDGRGSAVGVGVVEGRLLRPAKMLN
jgi:tRNA pseudouridine55 synthase